MELILCTDYWSVNLTYPNTPFKITFDEPYCFNREKLMKLSSGENGYISGGGNSSWMLQCKDHKYIFNINISGDGMGADVYIELPYLQTKQYISHILNYMIFITVPKKISMMILSILKL